MGLMMVVASRSKICQKVEKLSKVEKPQRPERSKGHRFGGTFTKAPILRQLRYKELELPLELQ